MSTKTKAARAARGNGHSASNTAPASAAQPTPDPELKDREGRPVALSVAVADIARWDGNPRRHFDQAALEELAESIRQHGLLEPVVIRRNPALVFKGEQGEKANAPYYLLIAGERRWRAAQLAGVAEIPVRYLGEVDDATALKLAMIENLHRRDLNAIEEAEGYAALAGLGVKQADIAAAAGREQPTIANRLRLNKLPEAVKDRIRQGELTASHGVAIARYAEFPVVAAAVAEVAVEDCLPVKDLEGDLSWRVTHRLAVSAIIERIPEYGGPFDTTVCKACPLGARRKSEGVAYCLRPDHYAELVDAAVAERRAAAQEQITQVEAAGQAVGSLEGLRHEQYEDLHYGTRPAACTDQCPCFRTMLDRRGELRQVCMDPPRLRSLRTAATRTENKAKRSEAAAVLEQVAAQLDGLDHIRGRELAVLVTALFRDYRLARYVGPALRHTGGLFDPKEASAHDLGQAYAKLAQLDPYALIKLGVETVLRAEVGEAELQGVQHARRTRWYLGQEEAPGVGAAEYSPEICEYCGEPECQDTCTGALAATAVDCAQCGAGMLPTTCVKCGQPTEYCPECDEDSVVCGECLRATVAEALGE